MSFQIQGENLKLTVKDLLGDCDEENKCELGIEFHENFNDQCLILGLPFLKKFTSTFNLEEKNVIINIPEENEKIEVVALETL